MKYLRIQIGWSKICDIIGEQGSWHSTLTVTAEDKKTDWKNYALLNPDFAWDKHNLSKVLTKGGLYPLIY